MHTADIAKSSQCKSQHTIAAESCGEVYLYGCLWVFWPVVGFCAEWSWGRWKKKVVAGTSGSVKALVMAGANSLADTCTLNLVPQGLLRFAVWATLALTGQVLTPSYASAARRGGKMPVCGCLSNTSLLIASWESVPVAAAALHTTAGFKKAKLLVL